MAPRQKNTLEFNPNDIALTEVATYHRQVQANLDRVWENVLDWEHLAWLHSSSFDYVSLDECGKWGWRTWSSADKSSHIELSVDKTRSQYVARSYHGDRQISEIWTRLKPVATQTDIEVSFSVSNVEPASKEKLGQIYLNLYAQLWDEDEAMMQQRQQRLTEREPGQDQLKLGTMEDLGKRLPLTIRLGRKDWLVRLHQGSLVIHAAFCPHSLGPLSAEPVHGKVTCPWHGYTFDIVSGECTYPQDAQCRLPVPPELQTDDGNIIVRVQEANGATRLKH